MKKWTKKFIGKTLKYTSTEDKLMENADKANKKLGIPKQLWIDLWFKNNLIESLIGKDKETSYYMAFIAGVAVGYAECNKKVK